MPLPMLLALASLPMRPPVVVPPMWSALAVPPMWPTLVVLPMVLVSSFEWSVLVPVLLLEALVSA